MSQEENSGRKPLPEFLKPGLNKLGQRATIILRQLTQQPAIIPDKRNQFPTCQPVHSVRQMFFSRSRLSDKEHRPVFVGQVTRRFVDPEDFRSSPVKEFDRTFTMTPRSEQHTP